jgi:hypothetical protein
MADELERQSQEKDLEQVSMDEIEAEGATALPNKEVMSLLNVDANVDLGLDLAAPVDLAVAANLNVAAPIEAAASANILSDNAEAVAIAQQHGTIDQGISGSAEATAPQTASIDQSNDVVDGGNGAPATGAPAEGGAAAPTAGGGAVPGVVDGVTDGVGGAVDGATGGATDGVTDGVGGVTDGAGGAVGGVTDGAGGAVGGVTDGVGSSVDGVTGGVDSLLNGGSLLDANVDINADADLTAPVAGAVAANANVAAPINASVAANIGSDGAVAQSLADQQVDIHQNLDDVSAEATAELNADIEQ